MQTTKQNLDHFGMFEVDMSREAFTHIYFISLDHFGFSFDLLMVSFLF